MAIIVSIVLIGIIVFSLLKGVIKMLLLAIAVITAIAAWIFIQKNGFTFLSFITSTPQPWMVQVCAWVAAIFVFSVFFHGMSWFSQLFSWHRGGASTGGILTTALMCTLMLWVAMVGVSYYGDVSLISYYHDRATPASSGTPQPLPWVTRLKNALHHSPLTSWLAYGCSLNEEKMQQFYKTSLEHSGVPHPSRFLDLFRDKGLRTLVEEKRFVTLLENAHLKTFLQRENTQEILKNLKLQ